MSTKRMDAASLARLSLHDPNNFSIQYSQTLHRLTLLQHWNIPAGSEVLEIGCGQGDCTVVIADAVGERGRVVGIDPAPLDYGEAPFPACSVYFSVSVSRSEAQHDRQSAETRSSSLSTSLSLRNLHIVPQSRVFLISILTHPQAPLLPSPNPKTTSPTVL